MQPQYFYQRKKKSIPLPEFIILDTSPSVATFIRSTHALPTFDVVHRAEERKTEVIGSIFSSLINEDDALQELSFESLALAHDELGAGLESESDKLSQEVYRLGKEIYSQLRQAKAYCNGKLIYQQSNWIGNDLVVQRLDSSSPPDLKIGEPIDPRDPIPF